MLRSSRERRRWLWTALLGLMSWSCTEQEDVAVIGETAELETAPIAFLSEEPAPPVPTPVPFIDAGSDWGGAATGVLPEVPTPSALDRLHDRAAHAHTVVRAHCVSADPRVDAGRDEVVTDVSFMVLRGVAGAVPPTTLSVTVVGGVMADRATRSPHMAVFEVGQEYLLVVDNPPGEGIRLGPGRDSAALVTDDGIEYLGEKLSSADVRALFPGF